MTQHDAVVLSPVFSGKSIQGEQQAEASAGFEPMDNDDVDAYVDRMPDDVIACRERGRHLMPPIRQAGIRFTDVTDDGLFVRVLQCTCCGLAYRVEYWEAYRVGRETRYRPVAAHLEYRDGPNGERYLGPAGYGRMSSKQVKESVASKALAGVTMARIRKDIRDAQRKERERA